MPSEPNRLSSALSLLVKAALRGNEDMPLLANETEQLDLNTLAKLSRWHQVQSLLYDFLGEHDPILEHPQLSGLKDFGVQGAIFNMIFLKRSAELAAALTKAGVDAFLMKGALWTQMLYEKTGLREFGDIDFFVRQNDIGRALDVFQQQGFQADNYRKFLLSDDARSKLYFATDYQLPLIPVSEEEAVGSLEIQWKSTYPRFAYGFEWDQLMNRSMSFLLLGVEIEIPAPENQLIMMIVHHGGVEQWDKLKYVADFVRLLRKFSDTIDWSYTIETARKHGFYELLLESLGLVKIVTGEDYGKFTAAATLQNYPSERFRTQTFGHWEKIREKPMTKSWRIFYFNMQFRDNLRTKLNILARHAGYWLEWKLLIPKARWYLNRKN